ncbi:HAD hydrolase-like protein [Paenibacillus pini]|uniref:Hydrolase n=1 Tax=Paenibacillus pini JCM 16418 TaxID=1236976 RepID=W7Y9V7_9BACL|nr:hydrolase [Paenibacillus pini JCM 16418]
MKEKVKVVTQAIIFDFDGLMVDTETPAYHAFCQVYAEYGQELPLLTYAKCVEHLLMYLIHIHI